MLCHTIKHFYAAFNTIASRLSGGTPGASQRVCIATRQALSTPHPITVDSREVAPGVVMDFDVDNQLIGIDIQKARKLANLSDLDQVLLSQPDDLTEEEWDDVRGGLEEFERGQWVKWQAVRRVDV